jgi:periplasmic copper chaperone A
MLDKLGLSSLVLVSLLSSAHAHVTLDRQDAAVGGSFKAVFRMPHGCSSSPTLKVRVRIPEGVVAVKPMPKPGWELETVKGAYGKSYAVYHGSVTEGVKEVAWTGRLSDDHYDEFILSVYLTDELVPGAMLYFPVVQECENGVHRWIEIPAEGKTAGDYKEPAPAVKLLPKK